MTANPVHIHAFDEIGLKKATEEVLEVIGNGFVHIGSEGVLPVHLVVQHFLAIGFVKRVVLLIIMKRLTPRVHTSAFKGS